MLISVKPSLSCQTAFRYIVDYGTPTTIGSPLGYPVVVPNFAAAITAVNADSPAP